MTQFDISTFPVTCLVIDNHKSGDWLLTHVSDSFRHISSKAINAFPDTLKELLTKPSLLLFENCLLPDLLLNGACNEIIINIRLDKIVYPVIANLRLDENGCIYWSLISAVKRSYIEKSAITRATELQNLTSELENLALTDDLTGLVNRRHVNKLIDSFSANNKIKSQLTVMMLDIDYFKKFNDLYGHKAGDEILIKAAEVLRQSVRETDVVSRYGGEEFLIIMPDTNLASAYSLSQRIHNKFADLVSIKPISDKITVSIGICSPDRMAGVSIDQSIKYADEALYEAKNSGRNKTCHKQYL